MRELIGELIFEGTMPEGLPSSTRSCRISSLDHEVSDHPMEYNPIIVSLFHESDEVLDSLRCIFWIEFDEDITEIC